MPPLTPLEHAVAGALSSTFSMLAFYPIDVKKTRVQSNDPASASSQERRKKSRRATLDLLWRVILSHKDFDQLHSSLRCHYVGVELKVVHTIMSSFTFFFLMTFLKSRYRRYVNPKLSTASNLTLSSTAAMLNTLITLPLDGLVTRMQTLSIESTPPQGSSEHPSPYAGLSPALLLSSNPAIHHTVFDTLKSFSLNQKNMDDPATSNYLDMREAFIVGLLAKSVATLITYPLIRAKQVMMAQGGAPSSSTLSNTLSQIYEIEGIAGLYSGLSLQLFHTALKSALIMSFKEKIGRVAQQLTLIEK